MNEQSALYTTISRDTRTGLISVDYMTVNDGEFTFLALQHALQRADKDGYSRSDFLKVLKKTIHDMGTVESFALIDSNGDYGFDGSAPLKDYSVIPFYTEEAGCLEPHYVGLSNRSVVERSCEARAFARREAAEAFVKTHPSVQAGVSFLWDLGTNQFTFFVNNTRGALKAYDFADGEFKTCREVTYSIDQIRRAAGEVIVMMYESDGEEDTIIPLYDGPLAEEDGELTDHERCVKAHSRLPILFPDVANHEIKKVTIELHNRVPSQYFALATFDNEYEGRRSCPTNLLRIDPRLLNADISHNPFVYTPPTEQQSTYPAYVITGFKGTLSTWSGDWQFSKVSTTTGRVDLNRTYKTTGSLDENTLDDLFNQALQNGAQEPTPLEHHTPEWAEEFITAISTDPWTVADVEQWSHICRVAGGYPFPDLELDKQQAQKAFEESASKYGAVLDTNIVPFPKEKELESRLRYIQKHWPTTDASEEQKQILPSEIEIARICDGTLVAAYVKPWKRTIVVPMCDALDKIVYRAMSTVEAVGLNAPTSSTVLRVTSPKNAESVICSVFSPAWARALAPEGATAKAPTLEQWMQYC
jgi:hypothetical protein